MTRKLLLLRGLTYHWRTNAAVVCGVAIAVAVIAGALLVGDSVRGSLRELVLNNLGRTDFAVLGTNPFRARLAAEMSGPELETYAMLALEGIVTHSESGRVAAKVAVYGVDDGFWRFHQSALKRAAPEGRNALLSPSLARELKAARNDGIIVRLDKPADIPAESLHGRKEGTVRALRLNVTDTLPAEEMGDFSLRPSQSGVKAVFVSLSRLQRELAQQGKANVLLANARKPVTPARFEARLQETATLEDLGIRIKTLTAARAFSLETASMVLSDAIAEAGIETAKKMQWSAAPVLTYLINSMKIGDKETPYSLVAAVDPSVLNTGDGVTLNEWAARDLGAKPGDTLTLDYYTWLEEGRLGTESAETKVSQIVPIRGAAADRDYAPEYPGITEAKTIHDWDPPFPMDLGKIRKKDEDYWDQYRTTPKAFLPLPLAQKLWATRYGKLTSLRLQAPGTGELEIPRVQFELALRARLRPANGGLTVINARGDGLAASSGSTDFGEYFLYFSFFLLVSALLLAGLFFRLGVEQRYREAGLLRALGFSVAFIGRLFLSEGLILAAAGALLGTVFAAAYAALILYGLRTWWVDAVGTQLLRLHVHASSLAAGAAGGLLTAVFVIWIAARALRGPTPRALLHGEGGAGSIAQGKTRRSFWIAITCAMAGFGMLAASVVGKMDATGGFFGAGALLLIGALAGIRVWLAAGVVEARSVWRLGLRNATHRPGRSVLSMALIAFAAFLILALSAFRQEGASQDPAQWPGTGGFALVGESVLPVIHHPGTMAGRQELGFPTDAETLFANVKVVPLRMRPGDDASCLNLYQPRNPRILALPDDVLFRMPLSSEKIAPGAGEIPAFVDANSLQYVLHKKAGDAIVVDGSHGKPVTLRIQATIKDSIFQSEILIREKDFLKAFPAEQGFRMFLVQSPLQKTAEITTLMEDRLKDSGLDLQGTVERLAGFHRVENAYLSTFQALGALGLLLGTAGLAAVLLRNVLERRKELALLRAVGYRPNQLAKLVIAENVLLLAGGLTTGAACAALAIAPAIAARGQHLPLGSLAGLLLLVALTGLLASVLAVKAAMRTPLLASLRAE
ncbi:MAG: FtsX-like permease family protein [Candidatus Solibacter usitatus]|nr:FtsX-like permease family protein [Candidatus Solibacter usitatus]